MSEWTKYGLTPKITLQQVHDAMSNHIAMRVLSTMNYRGLVLPLLHEIKTLEDSPQSTFVSDDSASRVKG